MSQDPQTTQRLFDTALQNTPNLSQRERIIDEILGAAHAYATTRPADYVPSPEIGNWDIHTGPLSLVWHVLVPIPEGRPVKLDAYGNPQREQLAFCECDHRPGSSLSVAEDLCYALNFGRNLKIHSRRVKTC
jgi:hypothetical protein